MVTSRNQGIPPSVPADALATIRPTWYAGKDTVWGEAWTMLHFPYTAMVLGFVTIGAIVSPRFSWPILLGSLVAYFLGLGVGAHFLDQIPGMGSRYVHHWSPWALTLIGAAGVGGGLVIGVFGALILLGPWFLLFVAVQTLGALGYPLAPVFRGLLHRDSVFAVTWGSLPFLTSYYAQSGQVITVLSVSLAVLFAGIALLEIRVSRASRESRKEARAVRSSGASSAGEALSRFRRSDRILEGLSLGTIALTVTAFVIRVWVGV